MLLYANGDSNTYGAEIIQPHLRHLESSPTMISGKATEAERREIDAYRTAHAWSGVLAAQLGASVVNQALPGRSNHYIFRTTMEWIARNESAIRAAPADYAFVIGWSGPDRYEFKTDEWQYIGPGFGERKASRFYYENLHSDEQAGVFTGQYMVALHALLKGLGVRHLFFDAYAAFDWRHCQYLKPMIDPAVMVPEVLIQRLAPYPRGPANHPLEEGQQAWAEYLSQILTAAGDVAKFC